MHTGFYVQAEQDPFFEFLQEPDPTAVIEGHKDFSPYDFLHGRCDEFAKALHDTFGYPAYVIHDDNDGIVHCFCVGTVDDHFVFLDVRGATDDFHEFIQEFEDWCDIDTVGEYFESMDCETLDCSSSVMDYALDLIAKREESYRKFGNKDIELPKERDEDIDRV